MSTDRAKNRVAAGEVLGAPPLWAKERRAWEGIVGNNEVVYEDHHVVVFHDPVDEEHESVRVEGELRLTLVLKGDGVDSLMDLSVADEELSAAILHGIQQAALRLGLQRQGFEVRTHVYPPLQSRPELVFKMRAGKPPKRTVLSGG